MLYAPTTIYIPSIDAKDLYLSNHSREGGQDDAGFRLTTSQGEPCLNRFHSALDYSLDQEKLREIAKKVYGKGEAFTFSCGQKEYSDKVISVTFRYSSKDFNKVRKNTYVCEGFRLEDLDFQDNIAVEEGRIVGIIVKTPTKTKTRFPLPPGFAYVEESKDLHVYTAGNTATSCSRRKLREELYSHGFFCNGNHYVRLKRTSGSARAGKCLFVDQRLYPAIHQWEMCGLDICEGDSVDLAALESYISLSASSAVGALNIPPESILVIPDCESRFSEEAVIVEMGEDKRISAREGQTEVTNSLFDGQSLIDRSILGAYSGCGMVLLRNRFFKSCCFNTNIQKWFKDKGITNLSQLNRDAVTLAEKIEDIKLVTTPSSIKYMKFAPLSQWLSTLEPTFTVVKHDKKTRYFGGRMVQAHYQLLNTLQLSPWEVHRLLEPSLNYVNLLNTDVDVLKYHIRCSRLTPGEDEELSNVFEDKSDLVYTMLRAAKSFAQTKYFHDFKKETCKAYLKNMKKGHILIDGNYSVLFGNPYEMLLHTIGAFDADRGETSLPPGHIHTTRYPYGKKLLGCRSPHISTSNILISTNMRHDLIDMYFNLTEEIVCLNAMGENILERLSGADYDSDQMILSDNEILVRAALENYEVFKVPANHVTARKSARTYTSAQKADLDYCTSENRIGEIVNLSQELNTLMWDTVNRSGRPLKESYDTVRELYHDICILNVLSCIEIDKAKKEFDISSATEIKKIKEKWARRDEEDRVIKPAFLGFIAQTKGYLDPAKKKYAHHQTSMDYLLEEIRRYRSGKTDAKNLLPLSECFRFPGFQGASVNRKQTSRITALCEDTVLAIQAVWAREYYTPQEKYLLTEQYRDDLAAKIQKMKINPHTLFTLITFTDMKKYAHISKLLFYVLFRYKNESMIGLIRNLEPDTSYIEEAPDGDITLYGIRFKRKTAGR